MHVRAAVAVHHTLRVTSGAARVTHRGAGVLADLRVVVAARLGGQKLVVVEKAVAQRRGVARTFDDDVLHGGELVAHAGQQWRDGCVDDDDTILGVVDDIRQLLGEQPNVERVQHGAHARNSEVCLHMGLVVPHERADAITGLHAQAGQRRSQLIGAGSDLSERALHVRGIAFLTGERDDLAVGVNLPAVLEDGQQGQLVVVHHRAGHGADRHMVSPLSRCRFSRRPAVVKNRPP